MSNLSTTALVKAATGGDAADYILDEASFAQSGPNLADKFTTLVKGVGYANTEKPVAFGSSGNSVLTDPDKVFKRAMRAEKSWKNAISEGYRNPDGVYKSLSPAFRQQFGAFAQSSPQNVMMGQWMAQVNEALKDVGKSITTTSPLASGLVPFNLAAPSRLIYPVYSPFRNKLPRTQGQGLSYRQKVVTGVSGSQTGSSGGQFVDISIPELVGGNMNAWPLNIPASGAQDSVDLNVPYRFMGLSENVSWLAQFAGQGFEDVSALANLILLQEFMLNEEAQLIGATSTVLPAPAAPVLAVRTPNAGESALSGTITTNTVNIKVTAANWYGETAASAPTANATVTSGTNVVDVTITPVPGALWYNIYCAVGTSPAAGAYFRINQGVGGVNFTLQGPVPTSGTVAPAADTGTFSANRMEGIVPTLSGHSAGGGQVYPTGWQGGYVNQAAGSTLNTALLNTALQKLWDGTGAFRADPAELVGEGGDIMRLSNDIVSAGNNQNYRLFVEQSDSPGVRAGAAVSEFTNPVTRSIVRIVVHPWLPQGTATLMSYTLPFAWSNVANCWEVNLVQDYLSISWPVIDATFRYSLYEYGALAANSPQYSGLIQGIQAGTRSGSTGSWS
jgi:hypothetical protein